MNEMDEFVERMKEEEKKLVCVGEAQIELTAVNSDIKINGSLAKIPNVIVSAVCEAFGRFVPYDTRVQKCGNTTTIVFVDCLGSLITIDDLQTRVSMMHHALRAVSRVIIALSALHSFSKDYDGEFRKREAAQHKESDAKVNNSDNK